MKMVKVIIRLVIKNLKGNIKKSIFSVFCVAVCLISVLLLANIAQNYFYSIEKINTQLYGKQDSIIWNINKNTIDKLYRDDYISNIGCVRIKNYNNLNDLNNIVLGSLDESAKKLTSVELVQGRWPEDKTEIVVEKSLAEQLDLKINSHLQIDSNYEYHDNNNQLEYLIVGICNDYSRTQSGSIENSVFYSLPNAITMFDNDCIFEHVLLSLKDNLKVSVNEIYNRLIRYAGEEDNLYLKGYSNVNQISFSYSDSKELTVNYLFIVLITVSIFTTVLSLYLSIKSMKDYNINIIRLLKFAGASTSDISLFLFTKQIIIMIMALPFSILILCFLLKLLKDKILVDLVGAFYINSNILLNLFIVVIITVIYYFFIYCSLFKTIRTLPIETTNKQVNKKSSLLNKDFSTRIPTVLLGSKSVLFYGRKIISIFLLMALSITFFISGQIISKALVRDLREDVVIDYKIENYNGSYITNLEIPLSLNYGISERDLNCLKDTSELDVITSIKQFRMNIVSNSKVKTDEAIYLEDYVSVDQNALKKEKKKFGYTDDNYLAPCQMIGVDEGFLLSLEKYIVEGDFNIAELSAGKSIVVIKDETTDFYHVGDMVTLSQILLDNPDAALESGIIDGERYDKEYIISAVLDFSKATDKELLEISQIVSGFVTVNSAFDLLPFETNYCDIYAKLKDSNSFKKTEEVLLKFQGIYPELSVLSKRGEASQLRMLVAATQCVCQFLMWTMLTLSVVSLYGMIRQKIEQQKKSYAILRTIGFSYSKAITSELIELFGFILLSIIIGFCFSFVVCMIFYKFTFITNYPWKMLVLCSIFILFIVLIVIILSMKKIYKTSIIELMK